MRTAPDKNSEANVRLEAAILRHGVSAEPVVGRSSDNTWSEDSFLVVGVSREQAVDDGQVVRSIGDLRAGIDTRYTWFDAMTAPSGGHGPRYS